MSRFYLWFGSLLLASPTLAQEQFPLTPLSGIQVEYQWTGLEIEKSIDQEDFSRIRQVEGKVTGDVIKVWGTFFSAQPEQDRFLLEISVDGQSKSLRLPPSERERISKSPQTFELEMPIDPKAKVATILLRANTESIAGAREVKIQGTFKVQRDPPPDPAMNDRSISRTIIGRVVQLSGSLKAKLADWQQWRPIKINSEITPGKLRTSDNDSTVLNLAHGEKIFIDKNSEVELTESSMILAQGTLKLQRNADQNNFIAETPDYVIEFFGERLALAYMDGETDCSVLDGYAIISRKADLEQAITIRGGVRALGDPRAISSVERVSPELEMDPWNQSDIDPLSEDNQATSVTEATPQTDEPTTVVSPSPTPGPKTKPRIEIVLPEDRSIPIITLDTTGGYTPDRKTEKPELVIFADGRAIITDLYGDSPQITSQLSKENLISFLDFMVNDHRFYQLTSESMVQAEAEYKARQGSVELTDIPTTIIRVSILNLTYEVRCRGADFLAAELPEAKAVHDFNAIEARLRKYLDSVRE